MTSVATLAKSPRQAKKLVTVAEGGADGPPPKALPKGRQTKQAIVGVALAVAKQLGLEGLSIGALADAAGMSKSGVFAHFGSREELQISVVQEYFDRFRQEVFMPSLAQPRGLPRLNTMVANWMQQVTAQSEPGCLFISGAVDFDDRPGPVRDALHNAIRTWLDALEHTVTLAQRIGHLRIEDDARQIVFEIHGFILALHFEARFLQNPSALGRAQAAFQQLVSRHAARPNP